MSKQTHSYTLDTCDFQCENFIEQASTLSMNKNTIHKASEFDVENVRGKCDAGLSCGQAHFVGAVALVSWSDDKHASICLETCHHRWIVQAYV